MIGGECRRRRHQKNRKTHYELLHELLPPSGEPGLKTLAHYRLAWLIVARPYRPINITCT